MKEQGLISNVDIWKSGTFLKSHLLDHMHGQQLITVKQVNAKTEILILLLLYCLFDIQHALPGLFTLQYCMIAIPSISKIIREVVKKSTGIVESCRYQLVSISWLAEKRHTSEGDRRPAQANLTRPLYSYLCLSYSVKLSRSCIELLIQRTSSSPGFLTGKGKNEDIKCIIQITNYMYMYR